jgi:hypothetical protein
MLVYLSINVDYIDADGDWFINNLKYN